MFEGAFQPAHLLLILLIALVLFGPQKLPELGRGLGQAIRGFKSTMRETEPTSRPTGSAKALPEHRTPPSGPTS
jgi:sec-independent protein translocase protein TatA